MSNSKRVNRPKYSLEFKQDAARLVLEKGYSHQQAADHLGISLSALGRWVQAERKPAGGELTSKKPDLNLADQDELIRLHKENEQLRMEREVLKKAAIMGMQQSMSRKGNCRERQFADGTIFPQFEA